MKYIFTGILQILCIFGVNCFSQAEPITWDINSLTSIGGNSVTLYGNPVVTDTEIGQAVKFDGNGDALFVNSNPIGSAKEFTFEVIFKPDGGSLNLTNQPRFVCFWDPSNTSGPRMTIEIRVNKSDNWYFDGFLKTDASAGLTLIDTLKTHPTSQWMHAAVTYKNNTYSTYVNGVLELSGTISYTTNVLNATGKTSIGARYSLANWYSGLIKTIKITPSALSPDQFLSIPTSIKNKTGKETTKIIYPNPSNNEIHFLIPEDMSANFNTISLFSLTGEAIFSKNITTNNSNHIYTLDVSNIKEGLYIAKIQSNTNLFTQTIKVIH
jgi:hypothetical protein